MRRIYDLPEETLKRLRSLVTDESVQKAAEEALAQPSRRCARGAACVHRLNLTADQCDGILVRLRQMLARHGFEEGGEMLPIGHVYEGLIETFSRPNRCLV